MSAGLLSWLKRPASARLAPCQTPHRPHFRPNLDTLEDRTVLSTTSLVNLPVDVGPITAVTNTVNGQQVQQLQAAVNLAGQQVGTLVMDATTTAAQDCPILNLHVDPISLNLLGLHVDTSAICLDITAHQGSGLLGDLLCGLANADNTLGGQGGILDQLDNVTANLNTFLGQLEGLLDGVLGQSMTVTNVLGTQVGSSSVTTHQADQNFCDILNLSLGPIDLNLLGATVALDNCDNGAVTVDVTADPNGGLLGGLLCGVADGLNGQLINRLIGRLDNLIDRVGNLADRLDDIAALPGRFEHLADQLVNQLEKVAGRVDSLADVDRLIHRLDKVINRLDRLIENTDVPPQVTHRIEMLVTQLTRIVNRFQNLGQLDQATAQIERIIDRLMARL